jgi:hypothetical protein
MVAVGRAPNSLRHGAFYEAIGTRTELTDVGLGTRWGNCDGATSAFADGTVIPGRARALCEELILFRDRHGRVAAT